MDDPVQSYLIELAPLTRTFSMHLASYLQKTLPRRMGRPRREEGSPMMRTRQQLVDALDCLVPLVEDERQKIFDIVDQAFGAGKLAFPWLSQVLVQYSPEGTLIYPQRFREWEKGLVLLSTPDDQLDPHSVSRILLSRKINQQRHGWLPREIPSAESFWVWRQDAPDHSVFSYELPLVSIDPQDPTRVRVVPAIEAQPYLLWTSWRGVVWDDPDAWLVTDNGVIRWVGEITDDQALQWLLPSEHSTFAEMQSGDESLERRVLRLLAGHLLRDHQSTSSFDK